MAEIGFQFLVLGKLALQKAEVWEKKIKVEVSL